MCYLSPHCHSLNIILNFLTYDPTFYVSMTYRDNTRIILPLEMIADCKHKLIEPFADESLKRICTIIRYQWLC